jgi:predicted TIM-barrel fold metal-dependent hydrolase
MAATQYFANIISADSHVMEPYDLWWKAIGQKFGDRTPRVLDKYRERQGAFFYSGNRGAPVAVIRDLIPTSDAAAKKAEEQGLGESGYLPEVRVRFQEEAGVRAEVLNPTRMLAILRNPDVEVVQACAQVFNDWEAEFISYDPKRLIGVGVIPMHDVEWAVKELQQALQKGLMGPLINCQAPAGCPPYRDPSYDRFWAIAEEAGAPITLHILTGRVLSPLGLADSQTPEDRGDNPRRMLELFGEVQEVLANDFIFGGILDRFPDLNVVCSEFELSWIPHFMWRIDELQDPYGFGPRMHLRELKMRASDYMKTRVYHGLIDDAYGPHMIPLIGADRVLWGSDFPHIRSIGLEAQEHVHKMFSALPRQDQEQVVGGNAAKVFNVA